MPSLTMCVERLACIQAIKGSSPRMPLIFLQIGYNTYINCSKHWTTIISLHPLANRLSLANRNWAGAPQLFHIDYSWFIEYSCILEYSRFIEYSCILEYSWFIEYSCILEYSWFISCRRIVQTSCNVSQDLNQPRRYRGGARGRRRREYAPLPALYIHVTEDKTFTHLTATKTKLSTWPPRHATFLGSISPRTTARHAALHPRLVPI